MERCIHLRRHESIAYVQQLQQRSSPQLQHSECMEVGGMIATSAPPRAFHFPSPVFNLSSGCQRRSIPHLCVLWLRFHDACMATCTSSMQARGISLLRNPFQLIFKPLSNCYITRYLSHHTHPCIVAISIVTPLLIPPILCLWLPRSATCFSYDCNGASDTNWESTFLSNVTRGNAPISYH